MVNRQRINTIIVDEDTVFTESQVKQMTFEQWKQLAGQLDTIEKINKIAKWHSEIAEVYVMNLEMKLENRIRN